MLEISHLIYCSITDLISLVGRSGDESRHKDRNFGIVTNAADTILFLSLSLLRTSRAAVQCATTIGTVPGVWQNPNSDGNLRAPHYNDSGHMWYSTTAKLLMVVYNSYSHKKCDYQERKEYTNQLNRNTRHYIQGRMIQVNLYL